MRANDKLTKLGKWVIEKGIKINVFSVGGWPKERLEMIGFKVGYSIDILEAAQKGMLDNGKKVNCHLIDNEDHPDSPKLLKVGNLDWKFKQIKKIIKAKEEVLWDVDGTLVEEGGRDSKADDYILNHQERRRS